MLLYVYCREGFIMAIAICYIPNMETALSKALTELLRRTKGATQAKVAKRAGISQSYVSDLKNGTKGGKIEIWEKIVKTI